MSLLTLVQDAAVLVGLESPSSVVSNSDATVAQLKALAQQEGDELSRYIDWRNLKVDSTITGDGTTLSWDLPCDWDRQLAGDALFRTSAPLSPLSGPISDQEWLAFTTATSQPNYPIWRYFGAAIQIYPALEDGDEVKLEYRSAYWISSSDGADVRNRWVADSDVALMPERVMTYGLIWRWKRMKGLDYAEEFNTYQIERLKAARNDGGFRTLRSSTQFNQDMLDGRRNLYSVVVA